MNWLMLILGVQEGYCLGQVRRVRGRGWEAVTGPCARPHIALLRAQLAMAEGDVAARVLLVHPSDCTQSKVLAEVKR